MKMHAEPTDRPVDSNVKDELIRLDDVRTELRDLLFLSHDGKLLYTLYVYNKKTQEWFSLEYKDRMFPKYSDFYITFVGYIPLVTNPIDHIALVTVDTNNSLTIEISTNNLEKAKTLLSTLTELNDAPLLKELFSTGISACEKKIAQEKKREEENQRIQNERIAQFSLGRNKNSFVNNKFGNSPEKQPLNPQQDAEKVDEKTGCFPCSIL